MSKLETDIIVVAGGAAGLPAAIAAAQGGARVMVFEKASTTGGTANMGMGPLGIESRHTRAKQFRPTKDEAFETFMDYTHWRADARLVRAFLNKSGDTIHWLESLGVEFVEPASYFPTAYPTWHLIKPESGRPGPMASATMMKILTDRAKEMGVKILLQTPVAKLVKKEGGIAGVVAEDKSGEPVEASAKAVIVATGGFGDNPQMIKKLTGYDFGKDIYSFRIPGLQGDGLRMAWEVGAARTETRMEIIYGMPDVMTIGPELHEACRQPHLMVNLLGERFINEGILPNTTFTGNAISMQKDRSGFLIFDEEIKRRMEEAFDFLSVVFPFTHINDFDQSIRNALDQGYQHLFVADSIEELAEKTGIIPSGLKQTVAQYNQSCERGYDELFNKSHRYLRPIRTPKFYSARHFPSAYGSVGGIKINHRTEVLDKDWNVIPGLYAAGNDACSIYGDSYVFILPGNTMGFAVNTGRMAGENASEYVKTVK
ncbi:MAG TPA: FAD-dependent oxidoreductase [Desulfobacteraceae bacterium]|nr:FAD-dependent oxidoreductase [Desulfobacteraceae bacterium]